MQSSLVNEIAHMMQKAGRCAVCGLPMPEKDCGDVCSRRCASRRGISRSLQNCKRRALEAEILRVVSDLSEGSTICPGDLSRKVLPGVEEPLRLTRPLIFFLQQQGRLRLSQKGVVMPWWKIRGPFRVGRKD